METRGQRHRGAGTRAGGGDREEWSWGSGTTGEGAGPGTATRGPERGEGRAGTRGEKRGIGARRDGVTHGGTHGAGTEERRPGPVPVRASPGFLA